MSIEEQIRAATPSAAQLSEWAKRHPAPQEWYDEDFSALFGEEDRLIQQERDYEDQRDLARKRFWHRVDITVRWGLFWALHWMCGAAIGAGIYFALWCVAQFFK